MLASGARKSRGSPWPGRNEPRVQYARRRLSIRRDGTTWPTGLQSGGPRRRQGNTRRPETGTRSVTPHVIHGDDNSRDLGKGMACKCGLSRKRELTRCSTVPAPLYVPTFFGHSGAESRVHSASFHPKVFHQEIPKRHGNERFVRFLTFPGIDHEGTNRRARVCGAPILEFSQRSVRKTLGTRRG